MNNDERDKWEETLGFYSFRSAIDDIYNELDRAKSEKEANTIIENNNRFIKVVDNEIIEEIPFVLFQSFANIDGLFVIDNIIHKVFNNKIYMAKDGKVETINKIISGVIDPSKNKDTRISEILFEEQGVNSTRVQCGYNEEATYTSSNHRRVKGEIFIYSYQNWWYRYVAVNVLSTSYKKVWGKYRVRKNRHGRKLVHYEFVYRTTGSFPLYMRCVIDEHSFIETSSDVKYWSRVKSVRVHNDWTTLPYLENLHAEFTTRGVGNNFAVISCE